MLRDQNKISSKTDFPSLHEEAMVTNILIKIIQKALLELPTFIRGKWEKRLTEPLSLDEDFYNQEYFLLISDIQKDFEYQFIYLPQYSDPFEFIKAAKTRGMKPKMEIAVYLNKEAQRAFYIIEGKKLQLPKSETKQYVLGKTGGIERFKRQSHAKWLSQSAIVGYMEDESFDFWLETIDRWIEAETKKDELWSESDKLIAKKIEEIIAEYISEHKRKDGKDNIKLKHFWVKMN